MSQQNFAIFVVYDKSPKVIKRTINFKRQFKIERLQNKTTMRRQQSRPGIKTSLGSRLGRAGVVRQQRKRRPRSRKKQPLQGDGGRS